MEKMFLYNGYRLSLTFLETHTWKKLFPGLNGCPTPRAAHGMCAVGSNVVIFGGRDSVGRKNDLFLLDTGDAFEKGVEPQREPLLLLQRSVILFNLNILSCNMYFKLLT